MWLRKIVEHRLFLLQILIVSFSCARSIKVSEAAEDKLDQEAILEGTTTTSLKPVTEDNRQSKSPMVVEDVARNNSKVFRPSVHLGEIEQSTSRANPFNSVQHVRFENNVRLDQQRERLQDIYQDTYQSVSGMLDEATRPSRIKFQDDSVAPMSIDAQHTFDDNHEQVVTENSNRYVEDGSVKHVFVDPTFFQSDGKQTEEQDAIFGKPVVNHQLTGAYFGASASPYIIGYYTTGDQNSYQTMSQEATYETVKKPESGVLVLQQQSTYTRKRKFPYQFYQPGSDYHEVKYVEEPRQSTLVHPQTRKLSPWKKIIHLIGTFLPLGLLLATLTPNIVRVDNTTQPIVLSKLRAIDLPVEHKRAARLLDDRSVTCEDRSMCELILAGREPESNMLQNILWNLATRVSDDIATRNGLREVFGAVKKQDCTVISCR